MAVQAVKNEVPASPFSKTEAPVKGGKSAPAELVTVLTQSYAEKTGTGAKTELSWYAVSSTQYGPGEGVQSITQRLIRKAGAEAGVGVRIREADGVVKFAAQDKRKRGTRVG